MNVGVGISGGAECHPHVIGAEQAEPQRFTPLGRLLGKFGDGFVHDVPGGQLAPIIAGHCRDVIAQRALGAGRVLNLLGPVGQVRVPHQIVAAHGHPVLVREVEQGVGLIEREGVRIGPKRRPFQFVDRHDLRAIFLDRVLQPNIGLQVRERNRRAIAVAPAERARRRRCAPDRAGGRNSQAACDKLSSVNLHRRAACNRVSDWISEQQRRRLKFYPTALIQN